MIAATPPLWHKERPGSTWRALNPAIPAWEDMPMSDDIAGLHGK